MEVPKCVDDIRRYTMMYFFCMIYQLIDVDVRQKAIEELLTQQASVGTVRVWVDLTCSPAAM